MLVAVPGAVNQHDDALLSLHADDARTYHQCHQCFKSQV